MSEQAKRLDAFLLENQISKSERSFGESLKRSVSKWGKLSDNQWSAFQRMEARHSPEVKAAREEWYGSWNTEKARKFVENDDWDQVAKNYIKVYEKALSRNQRR